MSGIECINLLAFIQFIIAFDFGLYYLDNKHVLTEIYRKYQKDLKLSVRAVLSRANDIITESLKSENSECILNSAYLDKAYRRLKYLTDENQLDLEGCGFIGLYAGLYGFLCLFCIGMFGSQHEALVKTYILVTSQIVLVIELFISGYNLYQEDCRKYSRNLWSNIRFIFFITLFVVGIVSFDWTYKFFSEFEFPFVVISLIVLLFPLILFIGHIVISRIIVTFVIIKCRYYLGSPDKSGGKFFNSIENLHLCTMNNQGLLALAQLILPSEILSNFEVVRVEEEASLIRIYLDESVKAEYKENPEIESKGFCEAVTIRDFPIRDKGVDLIVRRRKWYDKQNNRYFSDSYDLKAEETRYSKEFAAFLKGVYGDDSYDLPFA